MTENVATPKQLFWLLVLTAAFVTGVVAVTNLVRTGDPVPRTPVPSATITTGPTPTPLCVDAADAQCWETVDEVGPPWVWRDRGRVR